MNNGTPPVEILVHADAVLRRGHQFPAHQASRAAALLARQALEQRVLELCHEHDVDMPTARMRSRLIVLRKVTGNEVADAACVAWHGLSAACHHHAYELSPTTAEIEHLINNVGQLMVPPPPEADGVVRSLR